MSKKRTAQYQLTKQFLLIFLGILIVMNILYLLAASRFVYSFVENKANGIVNSIKIEKNKKTDWEQTIDTFVSSKEGDALIVKTKDNETYYSKKSEKIFHDLYEGKSLPFVKKIVFSDEGVYYVTSKQYDNFSFQLAINGEIATELVSGMFLISFILNLIAIILGSILIYYSVRKWSLKLSLMSKEIRELKVVGTPHISIPEDPIEVSEVATAFNQLLDKQQEAIEREKQFITNASHDIRTPLAAIRGHVQLIKRRGKTHPEVIPTSIEFIDKESKRLEKLSNQLLILEREDVTSVREKFNLSELLTYEIEKNQVLTQHSFEVKMKENLLFYGRKGEWQQIFQNLIGNAIKYSPEKTAISVLLDETEHHVIVEIKDQGIGISEENKKNVFERFYRVDDSRTSQIEGSGIGLSIVKKNVTAYGGTIEIKDNHPKGTIFFLKIPKNEENFI